MQTATITGIGEQAISAKDPLVILFDESATPALQRVALRQRFETPAEAAAVSSYVGQTLTIDGVAYQVVQAGALVNENLRSVGHATLVFGPVPATDALASAIYLTPYVMPAWHVGSTIVYH